MTGKKYCDEASRFNDHMSHDRLRHSLMDLKYDFGEVVHACLGLSGESGEVADMIKKHIFHEKDLDIEHLKKEVGDVLWYVHLICNAFGIKLDDVMQLNIDKLSSRYPNGFNPYDANHRKEGDV